VVDWGVVCLLAANCGSIVRYAGYGRRYLRSGTAVIADQKAISHHFHGCTALLVLRFVVVKWRYIKYLALLFFCLGLTTLWKQEHLGGLDRGFQDIQRI